MKKLLTRWLSVGGLCGCLVWAVAALGGVGCQQADGYRTEAVGNGQGGVEIRRVRGGDPADPAPANGPRTTAGSAGPSSAPPLRDRIGQLEAEVKTLTAENARLKEQLATRPATQP